MSPRRPLTRALAVPLAGLLLVGVSACGTAEKPVAARTKAPDRASADCRAQWAELGKQIEGRADREEPSGLATRWESVVATVDYYATSARKDDCGDRLEAQEKSIAQLQSFGSSLRRWDMQHQLAKVEPAASAYGEGPRPPAPKTEKGKKGKRQKKAPEPPRPAAVKKALQDLQSGAPRATRQQGPGWAQAAAIDLDDPKAVRKARKDLAFLSKESAAYRSCQDALSLIRKALAAKQR